MQKQIHSPTIRIKGNANAVRDLEIKTDGGNLGVRTERKEKVKLRKQQFCIKKSEFASSISIALP
jgi:hypothetical protein